MFSGKMVATRRGTCLNSSAKTDETVLITEATPTTRITRRRTITTTTTNKSQSKQISDSQQENAKEQSKAPSEPSSPSKRETKSSRCAPTDSNHEADISDSESCCSVASGITGTKPTTRARRRVAAQATPTTAAEHGAPEAESCSSACVSKLRRSTRSQKKPTSVQAQSTTSQDNSDSEAESCSSVASLSKVIETRMITRSRRRPAVPPEEANPSEADSCSSAVSGPQGSTQRRSTRNRRARPVEPIPIHLEQGETTEASVSSGPSRILRSRNQVRTADKSQPYDSEGCQSGPSTSPRRTTRSGAHVVDSDLESVATAYSSLDSPCSVRGKGTPCSSRTGSASSNRTAASRTRSKTRVLSNVLDVPSAASEHEEMENKKSEKDQTDTNVDVAFPSVSPALSDGEDSEGTEDEEANKTVLPAEDAKWDDTLLFDDGDAAGSSAGAEMLQSESRREPVRAEENRNTEGQGKDESGCRVTEESVIEQAQPHLQSPRADAVATTLNEPEEKMEVTEPIVEVTDLRADDLASTPLQNASKLAENSVRLSKEPAQVLDECVDQKAFANQTVTHGDVTGQKFEEEDQDMDVQQHMGVDASADAVNHKSEDWTKDEAMGPAQAEDEGPSCSSNAQKLKMMPVKGGLRLLDSSEDESEEEGWKEEDDEHSESEAELCSEGSQPEPSGQADSPHSNALFVIDTRPGLHEKYYTDDTPYEGDDHTDDFKADDEFVDEEDDDEDDEDSKALFTNRKPAMTELSSSIDPGLKVKELGGLYISFDGSKSKSVSNSLKRLKDQKNQDQLLKKSVIVADFEQKDAVPPYKESKHAAKLKHKVERAKTTGEGWFSMRAPELTEELRNDLKALQMRSAMDPKRFYKKNDREGLPKYFQVGTVVDSPVDFYHSRIPKKQRKRTIMEELLADAEFRSFNKRKYQEIMAEKAAEAAGRMNKKKKKHKMIKKK